MTHKVFKFAGEAAQFFAAFFKGMAGNGDFAEMVDDLVELFNVGAHGEHRQGEGVGRGGSTDQRRNIGGGHRLARAQGCDQGIDGKVDTLPGVGMLGQGVQGFSGVGEEIDQRWRQGPFAVLDFAEEIFHHMGDAPDLVEFEHHRRTLHSVGTA